MPVQTDIIDKKELIDLIFKTIKSNSNPASIFLHYDNDFGNPMISGHSMIDSASIITSDAQSFLTKYKTLIKTYPVNTIERNLVYTYADFCQVPYLHAQVTDSSVRTITFLNLPHIYTQQTEDDANPITFQRFIKNVVTGLRFKRQHAIFLIPKDTLNPEQLLHIEEACKNAEDTLSITYNNQEVV